MDLSKRVEKLEKEVAKLTNFIRRIGKYNIYAAIELYGEDVYHEAKYMTGYNSNDESSSESSSGSYNEIQTINIMKLLSDGYNLRTITYNNNPIVVSDVFNNGCNRMSLLEHRIGQKVFSLRKGDSAMSAIKIITTDLTEYEFDNDMMPTFRLHGVSLKYNHDDYDIVCYSIEDVIKWAMDKNTVPYISDRTINDIVLNIAIALAPLQLPPYVLLHIVDFIDPTIATFSEITKLAIINYVLKIVQTKQQLDSNELVLWQKEGPIGYQLLKQYGSKKYALIKQYGSVEATEIISKQGQKILDWVVKIVPSKCNHRSHLAKVWKPRKFLAKIYKEFSKYPCFYGFKDPPTLEELRQFSTHSKQTSFVITCRKDISLLDDIFKVTISDTNMYNNTCIRLYHNKKDDEYGITVHYARDRVTKHYYTSGGSMISNLCKLDDSSIKVPYLPMKKVHKYFVGRCIALAPLNLPIKVQLKIYTFCPILQILDKKQQIRIIKNLKKYKKHRLN